MGKVSTKGICNFCQKEFGKAGMTRHLESCPQRAGTTDSNQPSKKTKVLHLLVEGRDNPQYWLHLGVPAGVTLATLDSFLRGIWLECCGHLSKFEITGVSYSAYVDSEFDDRSMNVQIGKVLSPGQQFSHEYDFGSTTELRLKVISESEEKGGGKSIRIWARNEPPQILCNVCGKPAMHICAECIYEDAGWLCDECAENHKCGEEMLLPVVNSPRVGVCGYTGPA